jgi:hypothetical protein
MLLRASSWAAPGSEWEGIGLEELVILSFGVFVQENVKIDLWGEIQKFCHRHESRNTRIVERAAWAWRQYEVGFVQSMPGQ